MKSILKNHSGSLAMAVFSAWIFAAWRLAGMPDPGFSGRIIPAAWLLAAILNGRAHTGKWFVPLVLSFTAGAWLWMLHPYGWRLAAALPAAGLIAWGISISQKGKYGVIRAVLPVMALSVLSAEINGDEVRFAEQASRLSGISAGRFSEVHFRAGDIGSSEGHHTPLFPLVVSPGLLAGENGLRIVPVILALVGVLALARLTNPAVAVAAALLYPGFSVFGLAMTGWMALLLFTVAVLLPEGRKWTALRFAIALVLVALKMRYFGLAAGILVAEYACMPARKGKWLTPAIWILAGIAVLVADRYLLGGLVFWSRYGNIEAFHLIEVNLFQRPLETLSDAGWSLFDPEAGFVFRAPWILAAIPGLFILAKQQPSRFKRLVIPSVLYWTVLIVWLGSGWHGLPAPAGRMFVPVVPLFAAGLMYVWNRRETTLLVVLSIAVSAIVSAYPFCRYNYADGTDSILTFLGVSTGFSMVRGGTAYLITALLLALSMITVLVNAKKYRNLAPVIILVAVFLLALKPAGYEAEDLSPEIVQGARLYPYTADPTERMFWFNSRERLLELGEAGQSILLPGVEPGSTLLIQMSGGGGVLQIGNRSVTVETSLITLPSVYNSIGRTERVLPDWPENRQMETFQVVLDSTDVSDGTVLITHSSGPPVYIDRIDISCEAGVR
ncbi:hypothetical protein DRQ21_07265 [Candidatus Fermentibacteria bacterium]|nr:MAG: hypothetical protein DRQ21_07265 [Candidatus Fermentibacteria bacterium]